jgi:anti-sigma regulatory factor (Ser/Thr protein kinase)
MVTTVRIDAIRDALGAAVIEGNDNLATEIEHVYASDLMSDVLAFGKPNSILLTGLASHQAIISAHMAEFRGVVFVRGKKPKDGAGQLARESHLVLMTTDFDTYDACVRIESSLKGERTEGKFDTGGEPIAVVSLQREFLIDGADFSKAGLASTEVKAILKKIGFPPLLVRRVAISTYEGEMNVIMHAKRAKLSLSVTSQKIEVTIADEGKGIADIELAMQEGYTTATEEMRAMGFGSGMGLPNIKRNSDNLEVTSTVGVGTTLKMRYVIQ